MTPTNLSNSTEGTHAPSNDESNDVRLPRRSPRISPGHVNGSKFQKDNNGNAISVPRTEGRREIANCGATDSDIAMFEEGYDSDNDIGPFYDAVMTEEEMDDYKEDITVPLVQPALSHPMPPSMRQLMI